MNVRHLGILLLSVLLLIIGYILGVVFTVPGIYIHKQINPVHLLSILLSIFLAIFVSLLLDRAKVAREKIKDLVNRKVQVVSELIEDYEQAIASGSVQYSTIVSFNKKIRSSVRFVVNSLKSTSLGKCNDLERSEVYCKDLVELTTKVEFSEDGEADLVVSEGVAKFSKDKMAEISSKLSTLSNCLFAAQISICKK